MKKKIAVLLALIMTLSLTAACAEGSGGGSRNKKSGETVDLVIYSQLANSAGVQSGWGGEVFLEKFNVRVTIINEMDGTFATRMQGGFLGDIVIFGTDSGQYLEAVNAGMLLDWEKDDLLEDFGPYISEHMQLALEKNRGITGGTVYGFGHNVAGSAEDHEAHIYYPYLRWDLYEKLGKPPINTLEDYIPIMAAMRDLEPVSSIGTPTYGVSSFPDWDGDMVMMVKSTPALYGWEEFGFGLYHVATQEFEGCLEPNGWYTRSLKFYNTLFQMGLYDPDSMTQTFNDAAAKYRNGVSFWNIFTFVAETYNTTANLEAGKSIQCIPAADQMNLVDGLNVYGNNRVWGIGANSEYPELAMEIINWLCTPEGVLTNEYGPQGVTWDYDENGNTFLTDVGFKTRDDKRTIIEFNGVEMIYQEGELQHNNMTWNRDSVNPDAANGDTFNWRNWESTIRTQPVSETEASWRAWAGDVVTADEFLRNQGMVAVSLGTPFAFGEKTPELEVIWEQVAQEIRAGSWSAIYAKNDQEFDDIIANMHKNARAYGYDQCIDWIQIEAQRRRIEENKVLAMQ
ncbi:MAG: hypothetical protein FWD48_08390 [Oscillospiraceae bacterium]|nr:hypothetical protein [Oscillospiraceae bacterium]